MLFALGAGPEAELAPRPIEQEPTAEAEAAAEWRDGGTPAQACNKELELR